jgi:hypothetical protein
MLYVWKQYKATLSGTVVKRVTCEKCSCAYAYELTRQARGTGTSPYFLDNAGAEHRARTQASKRLRRALEHGIDPVGCPDCGWYQADMATEARRRRLRWIVPVAIVLLALAGAFALIVGMVWGASPQPWSTESLLGTAARIGGMAGVAFLMLTIRWVVVRRTELNRGYPTRPAPYAGAPVAHKVEAAPAGPKAPLRSVRAAAAVGAYPAPPPRSLKPSSKVPPRA